MRLSIILFIFFSFAPSFAQQVTPLANGYYVVVSTFMRHQSKEAASYSETLNKRGFHSGYGLEEGKGFVYVYLESYNFSQFRQAIDRMMLARSKDSFAAAWVLKIKDGREIKEGTPVTDSITVKSVTPERQETVTASLVTEYIPNPTPKPVIKPQHLGNTPIFLSVIQKSNQKVLNGTVKILDADNSKVLGSVKANGYFTIPDPKSKTGSISLVASAFGFKDITQSINYKETERDTLNEDVTLFGNFFMVTFEMERITKGSSSTLSGVTFFNDAAIMVPTSQDQLLGVLEMLNQEPKMRIRIEGHTNGNARGDIVYMGSSKNYFALGKDVVRDKGSAKELSQARAEVIKSWLVNEGIAEDRIEAVGMGGNKPIYDSKSSFARRNGRVELTVLD
ncbi:hypothetical protein WSM22_26540 [Cytophagales bacterium WSM2-2]|nr:hypothetical protein WSM22_26540 [Cytophagales bacterium WSM2-2]